MQKIFYQIFLFSFIFGQPIIQTVSKRLETIKDSTVAWGMENIFDPSELRKNNITTFQIMGDAPCSIQDPTLALSYLFKHNAGTQIIDFSIVDSHIYYLTNNTVKTVDLALKTNYDDQNSIEILNIPEQYNFTYIDAKYFLFDNIVIFLKSSINSSLYYVISKGLNNFGNSQLQKLGDFEYFTDEMKMSILGNYIFIPNGNAGISIYKFSHENSNFTFMENLNFTSDARDITVKPYSTYNSLLLIIADYEKGLILCTFDISNMRVLNQEIMPEFIRVKSVAWVEKDMKNKLIILQESLGNTSKFIVLSFDLRPDKGYDNLAYEQLKLIDGRAKYGDANSDYAVILLPNAIMITGLVQNGNEQVGYINNQDVKYTKLYYSEKIKGIWLLYTREAEIVGTYVMNTMGFLYCSTGPIPKDYEFTVIAKSQNCALILGANNSANCALEANILIHVEEFSYQETMDNMENLGIILGSISLFLLLIVTIALIIIGIRYRAARQSLTAYQSLENKNKLESESPRKISDQQNDSNRPSNIPPPQSKQI